MGPRIQQHLSKSLALLALLLVLPFLVAAAPGQLWNLRDADILNVI